MGCVKSSASGTKTVTKPVEQVIRPKQASLNNGLTTKTSNDESENLNEVFDSEKQRLEKILNYEYEILSILGKGSCAIVYKALYKKTQEIRALKCSYAKITPEKKIQFEKLLENEGRLMSGLSNDRIVKLFETVSTSDERILIMEYCEGGRLFDALRQANSLVNEKIVCVIMEQLLKAVAYLHSKRIIHRDIKMENLLLESDNLELGLIKLIDLGISAEMIDQTKLNKVTGSSGYMAPELLLGSYDEKIDEWACGVIMYILLAGDMPYKGKGFAQIKDLILTKDINFDEPAFSAASSEAMDLLKHLLERDSTKRISAKDALESNWIKNNQISEVQSLDEFNLYSMSEINFNDAEAKALLEVLMIGSLTKKTQDKQQVSDIFQKINRKNQQEINFEDLAAEIIVQAVAEKKIRLPELRLKVRSEKILIERRVFLNLLCKVAFRDDIQMKGVLLGYMSARETSKDLAGQVEDCMLSTFGINKQQYQRYVTSKDKLSSDVFYNIQLVVFL